MDTIEKIKSAKIVNIIKVVFGSTLLELYFNVEYLNEKLTFKLSISDDGETILFSIDKEWVTLNDITYEVYSSVEVSKNNDELSKLLGNEISNIQFGIGSTFDDFPRVIYYIKITTNINEFLFFNNGDEGAYSFNRINAILETDIYGYEWSSKPPLE